MSFVGLLLYNTNDGGNLSITNGVFDQAKAVETSVYNCLFGGNIADNWTTSTEKLQWWGNYGEKDENRYRSSFQSLLDGRPMTSGLVGELEKAAKSDIKRGLGSMVADVKCYVSFTNKRVNVSVEVLLSDGVKQMMEFTV